MRGLGDPDGGIARPHDGRLGDGERDVVDGHSVSHSALPRP
jgi:hypothetical protein